MKELPELVWHKVAECQWRKYVLLTKLGIIRLGVAWNKENENYGEIWILEDNKKFIFETYKENSWEETLSKVANETINVFENNPIALWQISLEIWKRTGKNGPKPVKSDFTKSLWEVGLND